MTLRVLGREDVCAAVADGTADVGLVDGLAAPSDPLRLPDVAPLTTYGVGEEPVLVLLPAGHPLARRSGLRLGDLADARWLDAPDAGLPLPQLRAANGGHGFRPALRYDGTDLRVLTGLVAMRPRPHPAAPLGGGRCAGRGRRPGHRAAGRPSDRTRVRGYAVGSGADAGGGAVHPSVTCGAADPYRS